jgi:outer membrane protein assembly factor BamB
MTRRSLRSIAFIGLMASLSLAADWPQYNGPNRDNLSAEKGLLQEWPKEGPPLVWTYDAAGLGYAGPAVVGDRLYLCGAREQSEYLIALDLKASPPREAWSVKLGPTFTFMGNSWGPGPRSTPTVDGGKVYALGGFGELICVEGATGAEVWRKNLPKELGAEVNPAGGGPANLGWGFAWAPLIDGDKLICVPGGPQGLFAALDKNSGKVLWRSTEVTDQAAYASPLVAELGGVRQYVQLTNAGVVAVDAATGKKLWNFEKSFTDVVIPTPIIHDGKVYFTIGYGTAGCDLIEVKKSGDPFKATKVFSNKEMKNQHGGVVLLDGYLYGYSEKGGWICQDFKDGKVKWADKGKTLGRGSLTYADGRLYLYGEDPPTVVLAEPSPKELVEKGRFDLPKQTANRAPNGKNWTHPVVANGKLYLRDQELLFCYDVKAKP